MANKKGFEFSFAWLFAILAGAAILFLAIFAASRIARIGEQRTDTVTVREIGNLFEIMETSLAEGKSSFLDLRETTRIHNNCETFGRFGEQRFSASSPVRFGDGWTTPAPEGGIRIADKYVFSDRRIQGNTIYFFSKPFSSPWKVSEIVFLSANPYCFVDAPSEIEGDISRDVNLMNNVRITNDINNCTGEEIIVCFGSRWEECQINVFDECGISPVNCERDYEIGRVERGTETMHYIDNLIYGAIFSNKETYECNVERMMARLEQQALLFSEQSRILRGSCSTISSADLLSLRQVASNVKSTPSLISNLKNTAESVDQKNNAAECRLW